MKFTIECRKSKKGTEYIALCFGAWLVSFDEKVICYIAEQNGYSKRDIYSLDVGDKIEIS